MAFMEVEVTDRIAWLQLENDSGGTTDVPMDVLTAAERTLAEEAVKDVRRMRAAGRRGPVASQAMNKLADTYLVGGRAYQARIIWGYGVRLSAPGYTDATDWEVFETKKAAEARVKELEEENEDFDAEDNPSLPKIGKEIAGYLKDGELIGYDRRGASKKLPWEVHDTVGTGYGPDRDGKAVILAYTGRKKEYYAAGYSLGEGMLFRGDVTGDDYDDARLQALDRARMWSERDAEDEERFQQEQEEEFEGDVEENPKEPLTVRKVLDFSLVHELIAYDKRESAREMKRPGGRINIYRMGLLLEAANKVKEDMQGKGENVQALIQSLQTHFEPMFPPIKKIVTKLGGGVPDMGWVKNPKGRDVVEIAGHRVVLEKHANGNWSAWLLGLNGKKTLPLPSSGRSREEIIESTRVFMTRPVFQKNPACSACGGKSSSGRPCSKCKGGVGAVLGSCPLCGAGVSNLTIEKHYESAHASEVAQRRRDPYDPIFGDGSGGPRKNPLGGKPKYQVAYIDGEGGRAKEVYVPDVRVHQLAPGQSIQPARGWGFTVIVMEGGKPVGWAEINDFGYKSVLGWMKDHWPQKNPSHLFARKTDFDDGPFTVPDMDVRKLKAVELARVPRGTAPPVVPLACPQCQEIMPHNRKAKTFQCAGCDLERAR